MLRYSLLTAGLLLGASAFAAPAGDLPLMPWPAKVERPTTQGALVLCASALPCKPAGRCSRRPTNPKNRPSALPLPKK